MSYLELAVFSLVISLGQSLGKKVEMLCVLLSTLHLQQYYF